MEYALLVFVHVISGILWGGGAILSGFFFIPSVLEAGPAGGAVMGGMLKRKFPLGMTLAGFILLLTGARLYQTRFSLEWLPTPEGIVLTLGALLAIGGLSIGVFVQRPTAMKMGALGAAIRAAGAPPTPEQAEQMKALSARLGRAATITAYHAAAAALLMAGHRLAMMKG